MRILKSCVAGLTIALILLAPPLLLIRYVGKPYPEEGFALDAPLSDGAILAILAALTWLLWLQLTLCLIAEAAAVLTDRPVRLRLPVFSVQRDIARGLLTALIVTTVTAPLWSSALAHAADAPSTSTLGSQASPTAADPDHASTARAHTPEQSPTKDPTRGEKSAIPRGSATATTPSNDVARQTYEVVSVVRGDTLWSLASQHLGDGSHWTDIAAANHGRRMTDGSTFTSADAIRPGWTLRIPTADSTSSTPQRDYEVHAGDTLWSIADSELGDGARCPELFAVNEGLAQPDGQALTDPNLIQPGWELRIPGTDSRRDHHQGHDQTSPGSRGGGGENPGRVIDLPHRHHDGSDAESDRDVTARDKEPGQPARRAPALLRPHSETSPPATHHANASSTRDNSDSITLLRALLATGMCLAGGLSLLFMGRRARQWRDRRPGRTLAPLPVQLRPVEHAIRDAGTLATDDVEFLDLALRHLALLHHQQRLPLPAVRLVTLSDRTLELRLDPIERPGVEAGGFLETDAWAIDHDRGIWKLPRTFPIDPDLVADQPAPYPALATIGVDHATHTTWLLDLESVGCLTIHGDPQQIADLQRYLAAELAVSPWAHGIRVLLADSTLHDLAALQRQRLVPTDIEAATRHATAALDGAHSGDQLLEARRDRHIDGTSPVVVIAPTRADAPTADSGSTGVRQRVAEIHVANSNPTLTIHGDKVTLQPEGVTLSVLLLTSAQGAAIADLWRALEDATDSPVPDSAGGGVADDFARADGSLRASFVTTREPTTLSSSLLPEPDDFYLAATATTEEDLTELAPAVPTETVEALQGLDPTLDADVQDWRDPDCRRPKIQVLGPVSVTGHGPNKDTVSSLASTIEFIVYLACRERGVTPERAATDLGWSERTTWNRALDARRYLGQRPDGTEWLPEAPKSPTARTRGVATYELHPESLVSADLFRRLRLRGQATGGPGGIQDLAAALTLVEGTAFDQLRRGGYGWLLEGDRLDHHLTAAVIDTAHLIVTSALASGNIDQARRACEIAILSAPHADGPQLDLAAIRAAEGLESRDGQLRETILTRYDDADVPNRTDAVLRRRNWLAS